MFHIGLDLGSRKSHFCICRSNGEIVEEGKVATRGLRTFFIKMAELGEGRVVLESCAEAFLVASWAKDAPLDVRIVPSIFTRSLGIGEHGVKTDKRDARALAQASCRVELRSIHIRSTRAREILSATTARRTLVNSRTMIVNSIRGWFRTQVIQLPSGTVETFCDRARAAVDGNVPAFISCQLAVITSLNGQIKELTSYLESEAESDPVCQLLMTCPGVGPLTALEFRAVIDEPDRFVHGDKVGSYVGLTPGEDSSSFRKRRTSITKAGSAELRMLLCQAAWCYWRNHPDTPLGIWVRGVSDRRGKKVAMVALMRKLAVIMWAMWRHNQPYSAMQAGEETAAA